LSLNKRIYHGRSCLGATIFRIIQTVGAVGGKGFVKA